MTTKNETSFSSSSSSLMLPPADLSSSSVSSSSLPSNNKRQKIIIDDNNCKSSSRSPEDHYNNNGGGPQPLQSQPLVQPEWRLYHPPKQKSLLQKGDPVIILPSNSSSSNTNNSSSTSNNNNNNSNNNNNNNATNNGRRQEECCCFPRRGTVVQVEKNKIHISYDDTTFDHNHQQHHHQGTTHATATMTEEEFPRRKWNRIIPSLGSSSSTTTTTTTTQSKPKPKQQIVITPETNFFRQLVYQINRNDKVLEIGCSTGETSRLIMELLLINNNNDNNNNNNSSSSWIGFDTSDEMIQKCREKMDNIILSSSSKKKSKSNNNYNFHVVKIDALVDPTKSYKEATIFGDDPTVIFIDIGGNRECINVLRMLFWVQQTFSNSYRLIVIKSRELVQSIKSSTLISIQNDNNNTTGGGGGIIRNGHQWFIEKNAFTKRAIPKHPLKAPLVLSPKDGKTPICRYHNYHKNGCSKSKKCDLDHDHCHSCQKLGHTAKECPNLT